jgi:hypothetical protein
MQNTWRCWPIPTKEKCFIGGVDPETFSPVQVNQWAPEEVTIPQLAKASTLS